MTPDEAMQVIRRACLQDIKAKREQIEKASQTPTADDFLLATLRINGPDVALAYIHEVGQSAFSRLALDEVRNALN